MENIDSFSHLFIWQRVIECSPALQGPYSLLRETHTWTGNFKTAW